MNNAYGQYAKGSFGYDLKLINQNKKAHVLISDKSEIVIVGDYQARVMTSTSNGKHGKSYGWINHDFIETGKSKHKNNVIGGEDRFWLGPEFGPYTIFFQQGKDMIADNIALPPAIDTEPFHFVSKTDSSVSFAKDFKITNYQGYDFKIKAERTISIFNKEDIAKTLGISFPANIQTVGFESLNSITNIGSKKWSKDTGLLSIWTIGAFIPSAQTTVLIPTTNDLKKVTMYWKDGDSTRVKINDNIVYYRGDGQDLHKIGIKPEHAKPVFGSYDAVNKVLTIVKFSFSSNSQYVNSEWKKDVDPYHGDVINVFNDGPNGTPFQFGPFYELESSSPAAALKVGESMIHKHSTFHFEGDFERLNEIAKSVLGVNLSTINQVLPSVN